MRLYKHYLLHFFISLQANKRGFTNKLKRNGSQLLRKQWLYFKFFTNMTQKLTLTVASFIAIAVTNCKGFQQPLLKRFKVGFFYKSLTGK